MENSWFGGVLTPLFLETPRWVFSNILIVISTKLGELHPCIFSKLGGKKHKKRFEMMTYHIPVFTCPQIELLLGEGVGFPYSTAT